MAFVPRGPGRGRGRGRGRGGNDFQQQSADGDMNMSDGQSFVPRGRGRGYQGNQFQQQQQRYAHDNEGDQAMYDPSTSRGRGRGGRGRGFRGGSDHYQPRGQSSNTQDASNPAVQLMKDFLARRYNAANKLLDLSAIATDEPIREVGMFATETTQRKFFPALMVITDEILETQEAKEAAIESVTLANNNLENTHVVYKLCWQLNHIKNLDLSSNKFASLDALKPWKGRFKNLEHIIVDPFPSADWKEELTSWYPKLKFINNEQVRALPNTNAAASNLGQPAAAATPAASGVQGVPTQAQTVANQYPQDKENMIIYVQQETNLKREYAIQCLEAAQWNLDHASVLFIQSQPSLPPDAYN